MTENAAELAPVDAKPNKPLMLLLLLLLLLTSNPLLIPNPMGCAAFKDAAASTDPKPGHAPPCPMNVFSQAGAACALL